MNQPGTGDAPTSHVVKTGHIVIVLAVLAIVMFSIRLLVSHLYSSTDAVWSFSINAQFDAEDQNSTLKLGLPTGTPYSSVIRQSLNHPNTTVSYLKNRHDGKTVLSFLPGKTGHVEIDAEFLFHITEHPRLQSVSMPLSTQSRELYLGDTPELDISDARLTDFLSELDNKSDDKRQLIDAIYRYVRTFIITENSRHAPGRAASELLNHRKISSLEQANLFVALLRAAKIPARLVTGFVLVDAPDIQPHHWVQIYYQDNWQSYDLLNGYQQQLPANYIPFRYNNSELFSLTAGKNLAVEYNLVETRLSFLADNQQDKNLLNIFNLARLSQDIRNVFAVMFLLPLGILVTVIFRHFIGVHNYGVFAPSLLALALTRNDIFITAITLGIVVFFVFTGRMSFPKKMNRTPRLAIIFTLVILGMGLAVSFVDYYLPLPEGFAVLLPVVILASLTDNIYKTLDTLGKRIALVRLFWTLIITAFCIPFLHWEALGHLLVQFPELHLFTLAAILFITDSKSRRLVKYIPASLRE